MGELKPANELLKTESQSAVGAAVAKGDAGQVASGEKISNCGVPTACDDKSIAVHFFSGKENVAGPRMCVNGV